MTRRQALGCRAVLVLLAAGGEPLAAGPPPPTPAPAERPARAAAVATRELLAGHARRYPELQIEDLYKLVHQGAMGSEHAVPSPAAARAWLERELAALDPGPKEPLLDPISADGAVVRVHLRPYREAGGDWPTLLDAFVRTANGLEGSAAELRRVWALAVRMAAAGELPFEPAAMRRYLAVMEERGLPAVHHSELFRDRYAPAYRVVACRFLPICADSRGAGGS